MFYEPRKRKLGEAEPKGESMTLRSWTRGAVSCYRSSESRPADAGTEGVTATRNPVRTHALSLGAKRGASRPSLISRVTAKRLKSVGDRYSRKLFRKPSVGVSASPTGAVMM